MDINLRDPSTSPRWFRESRIAISFAGALEMFVTPTATSASFALFLVPDNQDTVLRKLGGAFAVVSMLLFTGFAFLAYAVRYRINKQQITHPNLIAVKCLYTTLSSLVFLILHLLFFTVSFVLYYIDRLPSTEIYKEPGFWAVVACAAVVVFVIGIVWWYHVKLSDISPQRPHLDRIATHRGYFSESQVPRPSTQYSTEISREEL